MADQGTPWDSGGARVARTPGGVLEAQTPGGTREAIFLLHCPEQGFITNFTHQGTCAVVM